MPHPDGDHAAILTIDLAAIAANWRTLAARVAPAECAAAVKADAYGLGIEQVVPALAAAGCRTFFVAHLSEAERVRAVASGAAIHILNGLPAGCGPAHLAGRFRPVLCSEEEMAEWAGIASVAGEAAPPATIQVDTGMNRLGLAPDRAIEIVGALRRDGGFKIGLLLSHFVSSEIADDTVNARQIAEFDKLRHALSDIPTSLCNSSGMFLAAKPHFDMVRPGYALFGGNPTPGRPHPMRPVVTLEAMILQVRDIPAGATVGYNALWTAWRPSRLATVSLGYADGWPRVASGPERPQGVALVGGVRCPIAGRVSMDLIVLDVTEAPPAAARRGEPAVFLAPNLGVDEVGERAGTIGYHILTALGRRYRRRYV